VRLSLMPKKSEFFVLFEQHAQNAVEAAEALAKLLGDFTEVENKVRDLHAIEHYGDKLNHEIIRHLNETFVTPLDREDIVGLGSKIDDITDVCYDVSELVQLFKVTSIRPPAVRQAQVLVTAAREVLLMLKRTKAIRSGVRPSASCSQVRTMRSRSSSGRTSTRSSRWLSIAARMSRTSSRPSW